MAGYVFSGAKLLVVDDESDLELILRHTFREQIKHLGWKLHFAHDGEEALNMVREQGEFDALLTDINMPRMDGLTLLRKLDALDSDTKAIVVTAYGDMANVRQAMQLGAIDFVIKPIDLKELVATVNKVLAVTRRLKWGRHAEIQRAQAEAASQAKSSLLFDMIHELRTPLDTIDMVSDGMISKLGTDESSKDASTIQASARHLKTLIDDLLHFSRIEAGRMVLEPEEFKVSDLVEEVVNLHRETVVARGNSLETEGMDAAGVMVADRNRVRQCLFNLLNNACKFTTRGTITVHAGRLEKNGRDHVSLRVVDTGIGMSREQVARFFQHFNPADPPIGRVNGGAGLGLLITSQLCELLGGSLQVESKPGEGSSFTLELPAGTELLPADVADPEIPATEESETAAPSPEEIAAVKSPEEITAVQSSKEPDTV